MKPSPRKKCCTNSDESCPNPKRKSSTAGCRFSISLPVTAGQPGKNRVTVRISYYVPCQDKNHFTYGNRRQYATVTGIVWRIGLKSILVGETQVAFDAISSIESDYIIHDARLDEDRGIFDTDWEADAL